MYSKTADSDENIPNSPTKLPRVSYLCRLSPSCHLAHLPLVVLLVYLSPRLFPSGCLARLLPVTLLVSLVISLITRSSPWLQSTLSCPHRLSPFPLVPWPRDLGLSMSLLVQNVLVHLVCLLLAHMVPLRSTITRVEKLNLISVTSIPRLAIFA